MVSFSRVNSYVKSGGKEKRNHNCFFYYQMRRYVINHILSYPRHSIEGLWKYFNIQLVKSFEVKIIHKIQDTVWELTFSNNERVTDVTKSYLVMISSLV